MPDLFTIGYEGASQTAVIETLLTNDVQALVDIRELPQSRKPGLSKTALAKACEGHGIRYIPMRALGTPRDLRHQRRIDHDEAAFRAGFLEYLATQDEAMSDLVARSLQERCCLLCFEADPHLCHRWFVAERAQKMALALGDPLQIVHLSPDANV